MSMQARLNRHNSRGNIAIPVLGVVFILVSTLLKGGAAYAVGILGAIVLVYGVYRMMSGGTQETPQLAATAGGGGVMTAPGGSTQAREATPQQPSQPAVQPTPVQQPAPIQQPAAATVAQAPAAAFTSRDAYRNAWPSNYQGNDVTCHRCGNYHVYQGQCQSCRKQLFA